MRVGCIEESNRFIAGVNGGHKSLRSRRSIHRDVCAARLTQKTVRDAGLVDDRSCNPAILVDGGGEGTLRRPGACIRRVERDEMRQEPHPESRRLPEETREEPSSRSTSVTIGMFGSQRRLATLRAARYLRGFHTHSFQTRLVGASLQRRLNSSTVRLRCERVQKCAHRLGWSDTAILSQNCLALKGPESVPARAVQVLSMNTSPGRTRPGSRPAN